jgi:putative transposase
MRESSYTEAQIAMRLRLAESGTPVAEVCRQIENSDAAFYREKKCAN